MDLNSRINSFSRRHRLTNAKDYRHVFAKPVKLADSAYTILARANKIAGPRLGIIVSKKNIVKAAHRNRVKRVVRESFRQHKRIIGSVDVVVICKKNCARKLNKHLSQQLRTHWKILNDHAK